MGTWIDYTRRSDPAQPYYIRRLDMLLELHGNPDVLCFWTKNPRYVAKHYAHIVRRLQNDGVIVLAQPTWNFGHNEVEPGVKRTPYDIEELVVLLGADHVRVRYDPIILGYTKREWMSSAMRFAAEAGIKRIITNFLVPGYKDAGKAVEEATGIKPRVPTDDEVVAWLTWMVEEAATLGLEVQGCAEIYRRNLHIPGLVLAGCADETWAQQFKPGLTIQGHKSRKGCLCKYSGDWGKYRNQGGPACPYRCVYCYAK